MMIEIFLTILLGEGLSCFLDWTDDFMDKRLGKMPENKGRFIGE